MIKHKRQIPATAFTWFDDDADNKKMIPLKQKNIFLLFFLTFI